MLGNLSDNIQSGKPELWPLEFWQLIIQLAERARMTPEPRISLTKSTTPDYVSPISNTQYEFNLALTTLENSGILDVRWKAEAGSQASWVRLQPDKTDALGQIIEFFSPIQPSQRTQFQNVNWDSINKAFQLYGPLGLRTIAHITLGSSHSLDTISLPLEFNNKIWVQPDAIPVGSDVIRVGGLLEFVTPSIKFIKRWDRPGHFIWAWDIENIQIENLGDKLLLIENPYPYWELLTRLTELPITLVCLHGETRHHEASRSALANLLNRIYKKRPGLETHIWCDPDPGGIFIASYAYNLVKKLGGNPSFWKMGAEVFDELETVLLSDQKGLPISQSEKDWLTHKEFHPDLLPLANQIITKGIKGEQEGLTITISPTTAYQMK